MKHKFWLNFVLIFALALAGFGVFQIKTNYDSNAATTSFEISNSASGFADVSLGGTPISNTATNFDELLDVLNQNLSNPDDVVEINFSNFELESNKKINLSKGSYVFTGTIISESSSEIININATDTLSLELSNLTINANNSQHIVKFESTSTPTTLVLDSVSFNTSNSKSYGVLFESTNHNVLISGNNVHTSTYLYNHTPNLNVQAPTDLTNTSKLKIEVTYNANNNIIVSNLAETNFDKFELVSSHDFISVSAVTRNTTNLVSLVSVDIAFDLNGGSLKNGYTLKNNFIFDDIYSLNFAQTGNLERDHSIFDGWFGKITLSDAEKTSLGLNSNTLYFDATSLELFIESNYDYSNLKTSLAECDKSKSFTNYLYDSNQNNYQSFWNVFAFLNLGKKPEFVAKWDYITYTITFNTGDGTKVSPLVAKYNDTIEAPTAPSLLGHSFAGWFEDQNCTIPYTFSTMGESLALYAKWTANQHTLTLVFDNGEANQTITDVYNSNLTLPTPEKIGCSFDGWFDSNGNQFTLTTMPAEDLTLTAKWTEIEYYIYFETYGGTEIAPLYAKYNETITPPPNPTKTGNTFLGWYVSNKDFTEQNRFVFDKMPLGGDTIFARWSVNTYTITLDSQINIPLSSITAEYGSNITLPTPETNQLIKKTNYKFDGWFDSFGNEFLHTTMPANNTALHIRWTKKASVELVEETQTFNASENIKYTPNTSIAGFVVEYLVDGDWTTTAPLAVGTYDVKISRLEDATYASFETIIKGGLVITQTFKDFTWLIVLLFVLGFMEIVATIIVKIMHKIKSSPKSIVPFIALSLPISNNQLVLVIVAGVFALVCFVVMVYEMVKLIRATPNFEQEFTDINRSQIENIHKKEAEKSIEFERFSKYSADDIENMLDNDNFEKNLKTRNTNYSPDLKTNEPEYEPQNDYYEEIEYIDDEIENEEDSFDDSIENDENN